MMQSFNLWWCHGHRWYNIDPLYTTLFWGNIKKYMHFLSCPENWDRRGNWGNILGINSLWPSDAMLWQRFGLTLSQVMACSLRAPSHYWGIMIFISRVISLEILNISILKMSLKITNLRLLPHLPGDNELTWFFWSFTTTVSEGLKFTSYAIEITGIIHNWFCRLVA